MTTSELAKLNHGDTVHWGNCTRATGPRGGIKESVVAYKVTRVRTWKRDLTRIEVSLKHGMYDYSKLTATDAAHLAQWHLATDCPLNDGSDHTKLETHVARVQPVAISIMPELAFWRVVCSCGFVTRETRSKSQAYVNLDAHRAMWAN